MCVCLRVDWCVCVYIWMCYIHVYSMYFLGFACFLFLHRIDPTVFYYLTLIHDAPSDHHTLQMYAPAICLLPRPLFYGYFIFYFNFRDSFYLFTITSKHRKHIFHELLLILIILYPVVGWFVAIYVYVYFIINIV